MGITTMLLWLGNNPFPVSAVDFILTKLKTFPFNGFTNLALIDDLKEKPFATKNCSVQ